MKPEKPKRKPWMKINPTTFWYHPDVKSLPEGMATLVYLGLLTKCGEMWPRGPNNDPKTIGRELGTGTKAMRKPLEDVEKFFRKEIVDGKEELHHHIIDRQMEDAEAERLKRSEQGKIDAEKRWQNNGSPIRSPNGPPSDARDESIEIRDESKSKSTSAKADCSALKDWWNSIADRFGVRKVRAFDAARLKQWDARCEDFRAISDTTLRQQIEEQLAKGLDEFVTSGNWFGLPWLIKSQANMAKFLEGNYEPKTATNTRGDDRHASTDFSSWGSDSVDWEAEARKGENDAGK